MGSPLNSNTNAGATVMATSASLKLFADFFGVKAQSALHRSQTKREWRTWFSWHGICDHFRYFYGNRMTASNLTALHRTQWKTWSSAERLPSQALRTIRAQMKISAFLLLHIIKSLEYFLKHNILLFFFYSGMKAEFAQEKNTNAVSLANLCKPR